MLGMWRSGNRFTLLPEGARFLPSMLEAVEAARHSILLELYLAESGHLSRVLIEALSAACQRGVNVLVLLDGFGSLGLEEADRQRMTEAGIALRFYNPIRWWRFGRNLTRDHRKLLVVDGEVGFTGGFGAVDEFAEAWSEVAIRIEGPCIRDWVRLFARVWDSAASEGQGRREAVRSVNINAVNVVTGYLGMRGRVVWGHGFRYQAIRHSLQHQASSTRKRLWICTPYFVPTFSMRRRLKRAARRGVDVQLLIAGQHHDHPGVRSAGQRFYASLLKAGVRIHEFQPRFLHAKFSLADDWVTLGSCNFDHWSLQWNLEANQEVQDHRFAAEVAALFEQHFARSVEITRAAWQRRSLAQRCREWGYGTLDSLVTRLR
ncbi:phosphatidylserine/phosphatidylglycerophosphate/cardiolipin synthase family protein [Cobetia sp. 14N.309.X.WAT.E.A4]|uniref:phospholipase D-like domain-containing protein n=1 Tax=Cobetia sp. 14N.309.X.WAT.E.A4 TaxID=2998323 RepID=UPI0025B06208|nr:phosphatidylserine/phosphatidylglycerophosphate/cardiolipin synthase family protein [Cobetia sp. 14N.309.X.WAT.E.A4]MDN2657471.1 phosphatidylserine/phosphatidylglycerophosphate/cardiolipin synthase family protein [Cobetia sp. 14N.309.X.WAT.E.A4]